MVLPDLFQVWWWNLEFVPHVLQRPSPGESLCDFVVVLVVLLGESGSDLGVDISTTPLVFVGAHIVAEGYAGERIGNGICT